MHKNKFWTFQAKANDPDTGELTLYGDISNNTWLGDEITPKDFKAELDALGTVKNLNIYINSGGGDVFAGQAIYSMLKRHEAHKTVYVDGLAASIASVIVMAGDKVIMPSNAMMMIHNARAIMAGTAEMFRKMADDLEKVNGSLVSTYEARTGADAETIRGFMDAETWFTAEEAVLNGFADEIEQEKKLAASIEGGFLTLNNQKFDLSAYKNPPKIEDTTPEPEPEPQNIENRGESQPVSYEQRRYLRDLRIKINA